MTFAELIDVVSEYGIDAGKQIKKGAKELSKYDREDLLAAVGLEPKRSVAGVILPAVGYFAVGILAGVGLGLLFAPKAGYELREDLTDAAKNAMKQSEIQGMGSTPQTEPVV